MCLLLLLLLLTSLTSAAAVRCYLAGFCFFLIFLPLFICCLFIMQATHFSQSKKKTKRAQNIKGVRTLRGPRHLITGVASCACGGGVSGHPPLSNLLPPAKRRSPPRRVTVCGLLTPSPVWFCLSCVQSKALSDQHPVQRFGPFIRRAG